MSGLRVLVSGASIAGPMTAYWLAKAGATVTIVERFLSLRPGGQNVDIRTAGIAIMNKIPGLKKTIRANLVGMDGMVLLDSRGKQVGKMTATGNPEQQGLVSDFEILRGRLAEVLCDLTKEHPRTR